jgi:hypothetical protein
LRELRVSEMRYRAVLEVLDGAVISADILVIDITRNDIPSQRRS